MTVDQAQNQAAIECSAALSQALTHADTLLVNEKLTLLVQLVNSLYNLNQEQATISQDEINKIHEQFDYIKTQMRDGVNITIDETQSALDVIAELNKVKHELQSSQTEKNDINQSLQDQLPKMETLCDKLQSSLNNVLLAQSYQDLCGQVINRTCGHVDIVLAILGNLILLQTLPETISKDVLAGSGPLISEDDEAVDQDDIDNLFGSMSDED